MLISHISPPVPLAQRIARWTSNPKVLGSIPRWDDNRVFLGYLLKVMKKMNFGAKFCSWIQMLHTDAKTVFILKGLTEAIQVTFSIRQGDPLAMILYIFYVEPLLTYIEANISGMKLENFSQAVESFCDDCNILTSDLNDFEITWINTLNILIPLKS